MDPLFSVDMYDNFLSIYVRDLLVLDVNVFLIVALALTGVGVKIYRYRKNTVRLEPMLGVIKPKK